MADESEHSDHEEDRGEDKGPPEVPQDVPEKPLIGAEGGATPKFPKGPLERGPMHHVTYRERWERDRRSAGTPMLWKPRPARKRAARSGVAEDDSEVEYEEEHEGESLGEKFDSFRNVCVQMFTEINQRLRTLELRPAPPPAGAPLVAQIPPPPPPQVPPGQLPLNPPPPPPPPPPPVPAAPQQGWRPLEYKFNGDPENLGLFLMQAAIYMRSHGRFFPTEGERVCYLGSCFEGKAARWFLNLYEARAPTLRRMDTFMRALREQYEDPLERERALTKFQRICQGNRTVSAYAAEFQDCVSRMMDWPEEAKVQVFRAGLNPNLLDLALVQDNPRTVAGWMQLAEEVENRGQMMKFMRQQYQVRAEPTKSAGYPTAPLKARRPGLDEAEKERRRREGLCLRCGANDHFAASCGKPSTPAKPRAPDPQAKPVPAPRGLKKKTPAKGSAATAQVAGETISPGASESEEWIPEPAENYEGPH